MTNLAPKFPKQVDGSPLIGTIITLPDPRIADLCVRAGCDWILIDCEHGNVLITEVSQLICAVPDTMPVLVRIPANEEVYVKQALDSGCTGIICPQVDSRATAERLVTWAKYPPVGRRSVGISKAHAYGLEFDKYVKEANSITSIIIQIESKQGVAEINEILSVAEIGGVFVGAYDLSGSMGIIGRVTDPKVQSAVMTAIESCKRHSIPVGQFFATEVAFLGVPQKFSLDFVAIGLDTAILARQISGFVTSIREAALRTS